MTTAPKLDDGKITKTYVISYLAKLIYPNFDSRRAEKRIRSRISYSQKSKLLKSISGHNPDIFDAAVFFDWAKTKWPQLHEFKDLPTQPNILFGNVTLPLFSSTGQIITVPTELNEAQELYVDAIEKLYLKTNELKEAQSKIAELKATITDLNKKKKITHEKRVAAGKKGKGAPRIQRH